MAQIDQFLAMMEQKHIQCAMLISDRPGRIFAHGKEARGPVVTEADLDRMTRQITPEELVPQLDRPGSYTFHYESPHGTFDVGVRRTGQMLHVTFARFRPQSLSGAETNGQMQEEQDDAPETPTYRPTDPGARLAPSIVEQRTSITHDIPEYITSHPEEEEPEHWRTLQLIGYVLAAAVIGLLLVAFIVMIASPMTPDQKIKLLAILGISAVLAATWGGITYWIKVTKSGFIMPPGWHLDPATKLHQALYAVPDFKISEHWISPDGSSAIAVDKKTKRVCLVSAVDEAFHQEYRNKITDFSNNYKEDHGLHHVPQAEIRRYSAGKFPGYHRPTDTMIRVYNCHSILESKISEDGITLEKVARSSHRGGALLHALLMNKADQIEGAVGDETKVDKLVHRLEVRIGINDNTNPVHVLSFLQSETRRVSMLYQPAITAAQRWQEIFRGFISECDREDLANDLQQQKIFLATELGPQDVMDTPAPPPPPSAAQTIPATS